MINYMNLVEKEIKENEDLKYFEFSKKIIKETQIKVRSTKVKQIAKKYANTQIGKIFLNNLPHKSGDEYNVHGIMLGYIKNVEICELINEIEKFLPYINNWATCDYTVSNLKIIKKHPKMFKKFAKKWLKSKKTFVKRFAIVIFLTYFLDYNFEENDLYILAKINSDNYYVNMALAWYFSVGLVKHYEKTIKLLKDKCIINSWVHNKTIHKACESYRIEKHTKMYLKSLKR